MSMLGQTVGHLGFGEGYLFIAMENPLSMCFIVSRYTNEFFKIY